MRLRRPPQNPEAHALLTDQGAAVLVYQGDADFDDGDPENGPGTWGCPAHDCYQSESHDIVIEWRGMFINPLEALEPPWFDGLPNHGDWVEANCCPYHKSGGSLKHSCGGDEVDLAVTLNKEYRL